MQDMKVFGPPAIFFYDKNGVEISQARIVGFMESNNFIRILELVKK